MSYTQFKDGYKKETTFRTSIITAAGDTTNKTTITSNTYSFAAVDCSSYDSIVLAVYCFVTGAGLLNLSSAELQCYYA